MPMAHRKHTVMIITILVLILLSTNSTFAEDKQNIYKKAMTVTYSGGTKTVYGVWIDLNDPTIRIDVVTAKNQIGKVESLKNIVENESDVDKTAYAGINGGFFDAYTDLQPACNVQVDGEVLHITNLGTTIGFDNNNDLQLQSLYTAIDGSINGDWEWPNNWQAWNINHCFENEMAVAIFTPDYGNTTHNHDFVSVIVEQDIVKEITKGQVDIPREGFVIVTGDENVSKRFSKGDKVNYKTSFYENHYDNKVYKDQVISWNNIRSAVSAGPALVKDSIICVDGAKEGFFEEKILTQKAQRSFIGITENKMLLMATVSNVSISELAEIALELNLRDAINLDGGASSGLYFDNSYITKPGREISNAIVVSEYLEQPIYIKINDNPVFFDVVPYLKTPENRTMVPMRGIFEKLDATVSWDDLTKTVIATKDNITLNLKPGSNIVSKNGEDMILEVPVTIRNNRTFVPIRFITEIFGGEVGWEQSTKTVLIKTNLIDVDALFEQGVIEEQKENVDKAIDIYSQILEENKNHVGAINHLTKLYRNEKEYEKEALVYESVLASKSDSKEYWLGLGWATYMIPDLNRTKEAFEKYIALDPNSADGYYGLGIYYTHYQIQDAEKAKELFQIALEKNPKEWQRNYIESYLKN